MLLPLGLLAIGGLLLARSGLLDLRPFRTGLVTLSIAFLLAFGAGRFGLGPDPPAPTSFDVDRMQEYGGVLGGLLYIVFEALDRRAWASRFSPSSPFSAAACS